MEVWLISFGPHPLGKGYKASVINLTGKLEKTRSEEIDDELRRKHEQRERERDLLARFDLVEADWFYWKQILALPLDRRRDLAASLVELKRESHLFDRLLRGARNGGSGIASSVP